MIGKVTDEGGKSMDMLSVTIQGLLDQHFPGFVDCSLVDSSGCQHRFVEKGPIASTTSLSFDSIFPAPGYLACVVQEEWIDQQGRALVRITTAQPWSIESVAGETSFTVLREQVTRG